MRKLIIVLLVLLLPLGCSNNEQEANSEQETKEKVANYPPSKGNETSLIRIKINPSSYVFNPHVFKPIILYGGIQLSGFYAYGYTNAREYYVVRFIEADTDGKLKPTRDTKAFIYFNRNRKGSKFLVEKLLSFQEKHKRNTYLLVRLWVMLNPYKYSRHSGWPQLELVGYQLNNENVASEWGRCYPISDFDGNAMHDF